MSRVKLYEDEIDGARVVGFNWNGYFITDPFVSECGRVKKGDILKAAGYGAYTMVGAGRRGNVLEGNFSVSWTGANYLV